MRLLIEVVVTLDIEVEDPTSAQIDRAVSEVLDEITPHWNALDFTVLEDK